MKRFITIALLAAATSCGSGEPAFDIEGDVEPNSESHSTFIPAVVTPQPQTMRPEAHTLGPQSDSTRTLRQLYLQADFHERRFAESGSWLDGAKAAAVRRGIARLNGNIAEYVAARQLLEEAFASANEGSGPFLERANFHMTIHQIDAAQADVEQFASRLLLQDDERAAIAGLRGDFAFHSGDLELAAERYALAEQLDPTAASAGRLAYLALNTGDYDEAARLYALAAERVGPTDPGAKAWAELHRGIVELERNDVSAALGFYESADLNFSGWYLVQEHIAEAHLLLGDPDRAIAIYRDVLNRVPNGEFFAALGDAYLEQRNEALADAAYASAREAFERDIAQVPSAASGHALDFYLAHAPDRALELAEANFELRPGHEARTKLAQALYLNGEHERAVEVLLPTTTTSWATVEFMATAAVILATFDSDLASSYGERAEAISPGSIEELQVLLAG